MHFLLLPVQTARFLSWVRGSVSAFCHCCSFFKMHLSAASDCSHILREVSSCYRTLLKFRDGVSFYCVRHSEGSGCCWIKRVLYFFLPFQSHCRPTACRRSRSSAVSGGCWVNVALGHLLLVPCFCVLFIPPSNSRCFSISLWHHTLVNHNQMLFPGQHNMFRQTHTHTLIDTPTLQHLTSLFFCCFLFFMKTSAWDPQTLQKRIRWSGVSVAQ